jgi:predicted dehydrogenase
VDVTELIDFERCVMFTELLDDFVEAAGTGCSPRTTLRDAAHELAVVDAIKRSMASRRSVLVDDPEAFVT